MKNHIITTLSLLLLGTLSCSQEIEIEYQNIDPIYIISASLSQEGGTMLLTQSSDMDQPLQNTPITTATAWITSSEGEHYEMIAGDDGKYQTVSQVTMNIGESYTLSVEINDKLYEATSEYLEAPEIGEVNISEQPFTSDMTLTFCTFQIFDQASGQNYYRYRFRYFANDNEESGEPDWSLAKEVNDGEPITLMTHLYTFDRELEAGDEITIEVQSIDKSYYTFLYSLNMSSSSSTNPTSSFSEGALGYFAITSQSTIIATYE